MEKKVMIVNALVITGKKKIPGGGDTVRAPTTYPRGA
jgi:hypothetical protein